MIILCLSHILLPSPVGEPLRNQRVQFHELRMATVTNVHGLLPSHLLNVAAE